MVARIGARRGGGLEAELREAEVGLERLRRMPAADEASYARVVEALRRPREDPERAGAVAGALRGAAQSAAEAMAAAAEVARLAARLARVGPRRLRHDAATAAVLAGAAARGASWMVRANTEAMEDKATAARFLAWAGSELARAREAAAEAEGAAGIAGEVRK